MENLFRLSKLEQVLIQIFLLIWAAMVILPMYLAVNNSFKSSTGHVMSDPFGLAPTSSRGSVQVSGEPGSIIPPGAVLTYELPDGQVLRYETTNANDLELRAQTLRVPVQALFTGRDGNLLRDSVLRFQEPIAGIEPEAPVMAPGRRGGFLVELQGENNRFIKTETRLIWQNGDREFRGPVTGENFRISNGTATVFVQPASLAAQEGLEPGHEVRLVSPIPGVAQAGTFVGFRGLSGGDVWRFDNYITAWVMADVGTYFKNSVIITFWTLVIVLFFATMTSFIIARMPFTGHRVLFLSFMVGVIIPIRLAMGPLFVLMGSIGLLDTHLAVILTISASMMPTAVFILTSYLKGLSPELEQAARMDGASPFQIYYSVVLPLVRPAVATVALLTFVWAWNDFYWPLVFLTDASKYPLPYGLKQFNTEFTTQWHLMFAGILITIIPTIVAFLLASKQFISGLTQGGVKE